MNGCGFAAHLPGQKKVDEFVMGDGRVRVADSLRKLIANLVAPGELRASGLKVQIALLSL